MRIDQAIPTEIYVNQLWQHTEIWTSYTEIFIMVANWYTIGNGLFDAL